MTQKYEVVAEEGVEVNGAHYEKGHVFEFEALPGYMEDVVASESVMEIVTEQATPSSEGKVEGSLAGSADESDATEQA